MGWVGHGLENSMGWVGLHWGCQTFVVQSSVPNYHPQKSTSAMTACRDGERTHFRDPHTLILPPSVLCLSIFSVSFPLALTWGEGFWGAHGSGITPQVPYVKHVSLAFH